MRVPVRLAIGLAVAIALDTGLQLVWKIGVADIPDTSVRDAAVAVATNPIFILVVALMAAQLVNWLKVLDHADLSYAKPFTSLSYVTVCTLSVLVLGEHIAPLQIVGILVVVAGVWCVSVTKRTTLAPAAPPAEPEPQRAPVRRPQPAPVGEEAGVE
ncbi:MAG TPA: EamA family transporter [Xanthobacteraceae bacterium]|nr:EamA family transporter [Xanthobacteraceae bacterium]